MVTITLQCQKCEEVKTIECEGAVVIYSKNGGIVVMRHEVNDLETCGLLDLAKMQVLKDLAV